MTKVITKSEPVVITAKACLRCGHEWLPRATRRPAVCPGCNSPRWDEPKEVKSKAA